MSLDQIRDQKQGRGLEKKECSGSQFDRFWLGKIQCEARFLLIR